MQNYLIIVEAGEHNWSAYSPEVLGCVATGYTVEETLQNMKQALYLHLEDLYQQGEPIPISQGLSTLLPEINLNAGELLTFLNINLTSLNFCNQEKMALSCDTMVTNANETIINFK
jgi:predicted RNase H-like HicB family nuclease